MKRLSIYFLWLVIVLTFGLAITSAQGQVIDQGVIRVEDGLAYIGTTLETGIAASWTLRMQAGLHVTISASIDEFTPHMQLLAPDQTIIQESDRGYLEKMEVPSDGVYTILLDDPAGKGGFYVLHIEFEEKYNSFQTAKGELAFGDSVNDELAAGQHDIWTFSGQAGQNVVIVLEATDFGPWLELRDETGTVLFSDGNIEDGSSFQIGPFTLPTDGTYSIGALGYNPDAAGAYTLTLRLADAGDQTVSDLTPTPEPSTTTPDTTDVVWEPRFEHSLGITLELPRGFEHVPGMISYIRGEEQIDLIVWNYSKFNSQDSMETNCKTWVESKEKALTNVTFEFIQPGDPGICIYKSLQSQVTTALIFPVNQGETSRGSIYDFLTISAPAPYLEKIALSIQYVVSVSATQYLDEALRWIKVNYIYLDRVDWENLYQEAMASVDQNSTLEDAHQALDKILKQLSETGSHNNTLIPENDFGVGIRQDTGYRTIFVPDNPYPFIRIVYPGSPAGLAGLRVGDRIERYNGVDFLEVGGGNYNTPHTLGIRRVGEENLLEFSLEPTAYDIYLPTIGRRLGEIGYIETFGISTSSSLEQLREYATDTQNMFREVDQTRTCGWILDLRRNGGGNTVSMNVALGSLRGEGRWWGSQKITKNIQWIEYQNGTLSDSFFDITLARLDGQPLVEKPYSVIHSNPPVAILVAPQTASMGEISAYLFRSRTDAETKVFGEPTSGLLNDGISQVILFDHDILQIANSLNIDVNGNQLPERIIPDVEMETDYSVYGTDDDPLIQAAEEWLHEQPECNAEIRYIRSSGGAVNLRSGPGTNYDAVGTLENGAQIEVIGKDDTGKWLEINYEGGTAWIADFLTSTSP